MIKKLMGINPNFEMIVRRFYRSPLFNKLLKSKLKRKKSQAVPPADFKKILEYLELTGIKKGDIVIVHSAYGALKGTGLSTVQIVDELISLVGSEGTVAMPVIRKYPESPDEKDALTQPVENILFKYDVRNSKVWTGIIPITLMKRDGAVTSRLPLNTLCAIGKEAEIMMRNNLEGDNLTPNGITSPWKYCTDRNAWVISLGTDLTHSLTMIHTAEDVMGQNWYVKNWYREKKFRIKDGDFECNKIILERHPKWGMLHFGERKLCRDLLNSKIMKSKEVEGILVESLRSKDLFDFLNAKNKYGYPYFWVKKYLK